MSGEPRTQFVKERGDKVVTLDDRLDGIESRINRLERLIIWIGVAAVSGGTIGPAVVPIITKVLGL